MPIHRTDGTIGDHGVLALLVLAERREAVAGHGAAQAVLNELQRLIVVDAEEAAGSEDVVLTQPVLLHLGRVVGIAEGRPDQHELVRPHGHDLPQPEDVGLPQQDEIGPDGDRVAGPGRVLFRNELDHTRIGKLHRGVERADLGLALVVARPPLWAGVAKRRMPSLGVGHDRGLVARDEQPEGREIGVQQRRVIRVLQVLLVELPVAGQRVAVDA